MHLLFTQLHITEFVSACLAVKSSVIWQFNGFWLMQLYFGLNEQSSGSLQV